ncbi:ABC transporter substrate-binding protein [Cohnella thailandensis]|uniref:ABC transporter substrate-binding protein n=1 Tax=Cohnella thailandensis TaxID=557557 RepID=A0A841T2C4_9BACL|nr:ABC transporter substrate-binding protein [Cohnella thailandensis]MBB6637742.1 ABC transporter substrate-binding protein [Cohnella thailandensis]MBP1974081.1 peptide/nickel transport system substrate-binding protein [Cohnella thailandensis]
MRRRNSYSGAATLLLAVALVLSACAGGGNNGSGGNNNGASGGEAEASSAAPSAGQASAETPVQGGELTYALATSPDTLDPGRSGLAVASRVYRTIFDNLVVKDENNEIKPWLATEWTVSDDGLSYTFKLRQDVKFQDDTPFNAEAVKFTFDRILDPSTAAGNSAAALSPYTSSEIIDDYTIKLNLASPSRAFLVNLTQSTLAIVSPTAAKKYGDQFGKNPVGTGPFRFVKWEENAEIAVERNPDYHWGPETVSNQGPAYLDKITFKIVPEEATRIGSVQSKQVLAAETVPPQNIVALKSDPNFQLLQADTGGLPYTLFINQNKEPWNELKARQALQYGVDVGTIVKTLYLGTYQQAWSALTPGIFGYDASLENSVQPDAAKAGQLLDELGWTVGADGIREKDGKKLTLHYVDGSPNREKRNDIAVIVQQQLKKIGIQVDVEITKDVLTKVFKNDDYDIYGNSQVNVDPNALYQFYHTAAPGALGNLAHVSDPQLDQWLEQGAVEKDEAKRAEIYKNVQQFIKDNVVILPIYVFPYTVAASNSVKGLAFDSVGYPQFGGVYIQK